MQSYDCIVIGVGGFGSGALYHLARRGARVVGLEQFGIAHDRGSSHGETRIIRKAYFEHPDYVPLLHHAYELWEQLAADSGVELMNLCGLMLAGPADGEAISGARAASEEHGIAIENLTPATAEARFSGFQIPSELTVVYEADAGFLYVERCVAAHIDQAKTNGADLHTGETVREWNADARGVRVKTDRGEYAADRLVITSGAWSSGILKDFGVPLEVRRKPQFWHRVTNNDYKVSRGTPGYLFELPSGVFYGFPCHDGETIKVAEHSRGDAVAAPSSLDREVSARDTTLVYEFLRNHLPSADANPLRHSVCMYTMTPDGHFLVDRHPAHENVVYGAGFSGHGFKFTSVIGKTLADLAIDGNTELPVGFLSADRLQ